MTLIRGIILCLVSCVSTAFAVGTSVDSEQPGDVSSFSKSTPHLFSVGSGYSNGVYFMLATVLGGIISHPQGSLACEQGGNCGIDNLQLVNISTQGSAANVVKLAQGDLDSAFVQSNVAYWRYTASGLFAQDEPVDELRAIASLYPEMLHLVVHADSNIHHIEDLAGKRVAVGSRDSGTYINVDELLNEYGMGVSQFNAVYDDAPQILDQFVAGDIDAVFFVAGVPTPQVQYLSEQSKIRLIPIKSGHTDGLLSHNQYYTSTVIPKGIYRGVNEDVPTIAVQALWVVRQDLDDELVYQIVQALWRDNHTFWLNQLLPTSALNVKNSLDGIGIPLHRGAKRYYNEIGKRF